MKRQCFRTRKKSCRNSPVAAWQIYPRAVHQNRVSKMVQIIHALFQFGQQRTRRITKSRSWLRWWWSARVLWGCSLCCWCVDGGGNVSTTVKCAPLIFWMLKNERKAFDAERKVCSLYSQKCQKEAKQCNKYDNMPQERCCGKLNFLEQL